MVHYFLYFDWSWDHFRVYQHGLFALQILWEKIKKQVKNRIIEANKPK